MKWSGTNWKLKKAHDICIRRRNGYIRTSNINTKSSVIYVKCNNFVAVHRVHYNHVYEYPLIKMYNDHMIWDMRQNVYNFMYMQQHGFLNNVKMQYVRVGWMMSFVNVKTVPFNVMKVDWQGNLISNIPKKAAKDYGIMIKGIRQVRNSYNRSWYHNKKAEERLDKYREFKSEMPPMEDVFKLWNVSSRRELINHYGIDNIIKTLPHKIVDKDVVNDNPYELVRILIPDNGARNDSKTRDGLYLKMINPSTSEVHFEGVADVIPKNQKLNDWSTRRWIKSETVLDALAWRNGDGSYEYNVPVKMT